MILVALVGCAREPESTAPISHPEDTAPDVTCPPLEPTGLAVGERALDVVMADCMGAPASLHDLCGRPALIANWYGWCPSCEENAALVRRLADEHPDLSVAVVLDEDPLADPVDAGLCAAYRDAYPSASAVWMDPRKALEAYGSTDLVLVLDRDGTLRFVRQTATEDAIVAAVEDVIGA